MLIDSDSRCCDAHRKGADSLWVLHPFEPGHPVRLTSVDQTIAAEVLWDEVADEAVGG